MMLVLGLIFYFHYCTAQNAIKFQYAPVERIQIGGLYKLILPNDFEYLKLFNSDQRFAPDEPSSFSSIEYNFTQKQISESIKLDISIGLFRNHIKGDMVLGEHIIHFGKGNSHFGISNSYSLSSFILKSNFQFCVSSQLGLGPLLSQFRNDDITIDPSQWTLNGFGGLFNLGLELESPKLLNRISITLGVLSNVSSYKFKRIDIINEQLEMQRFTKLNFQIRSKIPAFNFGIKYLFFNDNELLPR